VEKIEFTPIGFVRSAHTEPVGVPINAAFAKGVAATIEILPEYEPALRDLDGFSHLHILAFLHQSKGFRLITRPFTDPHPRGLFATRSPRRPNPIALSLVKLIRIEGRVLHVEEIDLIDGTPVLDIKPFNPQVDHRTEDVRTGWMAECHVHDKPVGETICDERYVARRRQDEID